MSTQTNTRPTVGGTYWAALATVGPEWTTVWGSGHGAALDPTGVVKYGAALFTSESDARAYLAEHGPRMAPGAEPPTVARVTYVGGGHYRTAVQYQPYYVAYAHSQGFADPAAVKGRDTTESGRFRGHLFMEWISRQWSAWAAENGVREVRASIHGPAFGAWLADRWSCPVA